jgi:tetratricopeptide (TPR) repeat protein
VPAKSTPPTAPRLTGWKLRLARGAVLILAPALLPVMIELSLRIAGSGFPTGFFLKSDTPGMLEPNPDFARQYYGRKTAARPVLFKMPERKAPGTFRIFVLGESAAAGTPDPGYSFGRILEVMLQRHYPGARFEVCNAAMRGISSTIIRDIARDCARHEPDLFIAYMGNNDVIGLHAPEPGCSRWSQNLAAQRLTQSLKSTRLGQLLFRQVKKAAKDEEEQDQPFFRGKRLAYDDWRREAVVRNYAANLSDVIAAAQHAGAGVVLSTVAVNLRDCPPFGSLHRGVLSEADKARWEQLFQSGIESAATNGHAEAIRHFGEALRLDDHFAELHFRIAESYLAAGNVEKARQHFAEACNRDALQFRTDARLNDVVRTAAATHAQGGVRLVDAASIFSSSLLAEQGVPGKRLFNDHVHPTFDGDHLLASAVFETIVQALGARLPVADPNASLPTRAECARALAFTPWDEVNVEAAMVKFKARPPYLDQADHARRQQAAEAAMKERLAGFDRSALQECATIYQAALAQRPEDWFMNLNFGRLLMTLRQPVDAAGHFQILVKQYPHVTAFRQLLADALVGAGRTGEAVTQLEEAVRLAPDDPQLAKMLEQVRKATLPFGRRSQPPARSAPR